MSWYYDNYFLFGKEKASFLLDVVVRHKICNNPSGGPSKSLQDNKLIAKPQTDVK